MRLTTSPPSCAECHEISEPKPPETLWATPGLLQDSFSVTFTIVVIINAYYNSTVYLMHNIIIISQCHVFVQSSPGRYPSDKYPVETAYGCRFL